MEPSPDEFYLGFACHGCKKPIEIVIDDGSDHCRFVAGDVLQVLCRECGHRGCYKARDVQRYPGRSPTMRSERRQLIHLGVSYGAK